MTHAVLLAIALTLHRPVDLVTMVARSFPADPLLAVAVVFRESEFHTRALADYGWSSDFGLWQLNSYWHPQYRENLRAHVKYGAAYLFSLLWLYRDAGTEAVAFALSHYHSGKPISGHGLEYAAEVIQIYERLRRTR
jgi:hypothetical protein